MAASLQEFLEFQFRNGGLGIQYQDHRFEVGEWYKGLQ